MPNIKVSNLILSPYSEDRSDSTIEQLKGAGSIVYSTRNDAFPKSARGFITKSLSPSTNQVSKYQSKIPNQKGSLKRENNITLSPKS